MKSEITDKEIATRLRAEARVADLHSKGVPFAEIERRLGWGAAHGYNSWRALRDARARLSSRVLTPRPGRASRRASPSSGRSEHPTRSSRAA